MTKAHQEFRVGAANDPEFLSITRKGEFTVVVAPVEVNSAPRPEADDGSIVAAFRALEGNGATGGKRRAISQVARDLGISANEVYRAIERAKL